jgi:hypothetical protein
MLDLYSRVGKGKLVETVGDYEIRQVNPVVTEHEGQLFPYSYMVVGPDVEEQASVIKLPDQVATARPILALCQTRKLARNVLEFLRESERAEEEKELVPQAASRH